MICPLVFSITDISNNIELNYEGNSHALYPWHDIAKTLVLFMYNEPHWSHDYFVNDIFLPKDHFHVMFWPEFQKQDELSIEEQGSELRPKVIVYDVSSCGDDVTYPVVRKLIAKYKPLVLINEADEFEGWSRKYKYGEGTELYKLVPLVLRQYSVAPYVSYSKPMGNVMHVPLGYIEHMLDFTFNKHAGTKNGMVSTSGGMIGRVDSKFIANMSMEEEHYLKENFQGHDKKMNLLQGINFFRKYHPSKERKYLWSFIGSVVGHPVERRQIIEAFSNLKGTGTEGIIELGLSAPQMRDVYGASKFVVIGIGHRNLECFRMYEAIVSGAIPVVAHTYESVLGSFDFGGDYPPFVTHEPFRNWSKSNFTQVAEDVKNINDTYMNFIRLENEKWLLRVTLRTRNKLMQILHVSQLERAVSRRNY